eukprot:gene12038-2194_t
MGRLPHVLLHTLTGATLASTQSQPRVIWFVLADDYGHYDIGYNNPEAPTPTLNTMANQGVILDRHYVYKFCSPTRSSFLSGRLPVHVNTANRPSDEAGCVDLRMTSIGTKMKLANFSTHVAVFEGCTYEVTGGLYCRAPGKWHGGAYFEGQLPIHKGFDSSFVFLNGNEDHYTQYFGILDGIDLWEDDQPASATYPTPTLDQASVSCRAMIMQALGHSSRIPLIEAGR